MAKFNKNRVVIQLVLISLFLFQLLADFTVSINTTRVVVITYSSVDRVIRQVDHMTQPNPNFHKCILLEEEIPSITYNSGGPYTLGAIMQAIDVFQVLFSTQI